MQSHTASVTAKICAYLRGIEAGNSKKIFNDYLAMDLLSKKERADMSELTREYQDTAALQAMTSVPLSRSAWAEGHLACFAQGRTHLQYLILGAGLDTFAWRNRNRGIRVFEVDHPATQKDKKSRIQSLHWQSKAETFFTGVNFGYDDLNSRLLEDGFDPALPTLISILGVSYYLPFAAFADTLSSLSKLLRGPARILFDYQHKDFDDFSGSRSLSAFTALFGERMAAGYQPYEIFNLLEKLGWHHSEHLAPQDIEKRYFASRHDGLHAFESVHFLAAGR